MLESWLEKIHSPQDIRTLKDHEIKGLAEEIRKYIIDTVSKTGGHLASNLGVVELTIALHRTFNSPEDKIIWDVGHQCYVHKILTGRYHQLKSIRCKDGISGFPKRCESCHDFFETGHSSTSISAALGFAAARDLRRESHHVVAVIGDGSMSGGLAYEALNNVGHTKKRVIVLLNDNNMSISENVGAMSSYLSRLRTAPTYFKMKSDFEFLMRKIPSVGEHVIRVADRVKDSLKHLVVPGMIFEEMGFTYLGPIDGHNESELQTVLNRAKKIDGPVLIHAITKKGKGYRPAEENPDVFHGTGPFDVQTGLQKSKSLPLTYTKVFGDTLYRIAEDNLNIVGITAAMPDGTGLDKLRDQIPQRYFDVGIAESHAVTFAAGLASEGFHPVVAVYSTFLQRAYDQILMDVCLQNLPVIFAVDRAGIVGEDGETHQGLFDLSFLRPMPNMKIMVPKDENELQHMLYTATQISGPCAIRYPRGKGFGVPLDQQLYEIPEGKAELLNDGSDLVVIAAGPSSHWAMEAAKHIEMEDVSVSVVNLRYLKPLDEDMLLKKISETRRVLIVEENVEAGGLTECVSHLIVKNGLNNIVLHSISIPDRFISHGTREQLLDEYGFSVGNLEDTMRKMVQEKTNEKRKTSIHLIR